MNFRTALEADLNAIVAMLADDELGATREKNVEPLPEAYIEAFRAIKAQKGNVILLVEKEDTLAGFLQLTIIPGLARTGMKRAQIEGVRIGRAFRGQGIGEALVQKAVDIAKEEGCGLVQLTTDKQRKDAHRFYERIGFEASHEGMKLVF
ncbi:ribosomal protein S18 acetylase RimI-like enzyme [Alkalihalobacillus xiaoxiensis]|uniref:Ribosomal protein S18 acetylase RimI-like enzyme n=1 Tax=Shouchella xiaoxiensis TaxID=766895 RepID=A0ABS2T0Q8_9BACI|nr:GNAT family N-acetyltransferase [Shouchella xiaoxiensis]MBM7840821.1 ribosomal protein S18 acetylase RimI-like enzyme [Shouchella xiaoxiensis]